MLAISVLAWLLMTSSQPSFSVPHADALVRVELASKADAEAIEDLGFDVWSEANREASLVMRVRPDQNAWLEASGLTYTTLSADLGPLIEEERTRLQATRPTKAEEAMCFSPTISR